MEMENAYKEIAPRLVGLRDAMDMSLEEMASRVGVEAELVEKYESGKEEIPVGYLLQVAQACGVDLTSLVSGGDAHLRSHCLVKKGKGLSVERRKDYDYKDLAYRFTGAKMKPFMIRVPAKSEDELSFNRHSGQEFVYMLEGRLELRLGDKVLELEEGDSIYFDSQNPHAMRGLDGKEAVFLDVIL